ncbi:MAG: MORN repeat-containing protein [Pseudomonadales bacterium]
MTKVIRPSVMRRSEFLRFTLNPSITLKWLTVVALIGFPQLLWSEDVETGVDEAIIQPCDPFTDERCLSRVELKNGQQYEGRLKNGVPTGQGVLHYSNGDRHDGYFENGLPMGRGTYYLANGNAYSGFWVRGRLNGPVQFNHRSGDRYEGPIANHAPNGRGSMIFKNGDRYIGEFSMGSPHGNGVMIYGPDRGANRGDRYEGGFVQGRREGNARYTWADGAIWDIQCRMDRCERAGLAGFIQDKDRSGAEFPSEPPRRLR